MGLPPQEAIAAGAWRPTPTMALVVVALLATAGCHLGGSSSPSTVSLRPEATATAPAVVAPTTSPVATPDGKSVLYHLKAFDDTKVDVLFTLSPFMHANDPAVSARFPGGVPCEADAERDGVSIGMVTVVDKTPGFTANIVFHFGAAPSMGPPMLSFGIAYSNGNHCADVDGENADDFTKAFEPGDVSGTWGPVPIEFVRHGLFGPAYPHGGSIGGTVLAAYENDDVTSRYTVTRAIGPLGGNSFPPDLNLGRLGFKAGV